MLESREEYRKQLRDAKAIMAMEALGFMDKGQIFAYLSELAITIGVDDLLAILDRIGKTYGRDALKSKLMPIDLIENTINTGSAYVQNPPLSSDREMRITIVAATLLNRCIKEHYSFGCPEAKVVMWGLSLFCLIRPSNESDKALAREMLKSCGGFIGKKGLQAIFAKLGSIVLDEEKRKDAYNLLAEGYLENSNVHYMALTALWNDKELSRVNSRTPDTEILEALKEALEVFDTENRDTINKAKALFWQACRFPGMSQAKAVVREVRPDLIGELA